MAIFVESFEDIVVGPNSPLFYAGAIQWNPAFSFDQQVFSVSVKGIADDFVGLAAYDATARVGTAPPAPLPTLLCYSIVTDFARLRGWSTSVPMNTAV